jgi:hypothetical protein
MAEQPFAHVLSVEQKMAQQIRLLLEEEEEIPWLKLLRFAFYRFGVSVASFYAFYSSAVNMESVSDFKALIQR